MTETAEPIKIHRGLTGVYFDRSPCTFIDGKAGDLRQVLDRAARKALERAVQAGGLDAQPGFRAEADFLGVDVGGDALGAAGGGAQSEMDAAMTFVRGLVAPDRVHYLEPGDVLRLPDTEHHAYALGPPLPALTNAKGKRLIELLADGGEGVMYSYAALGMRVDARPPRGGRTLALSDDGGLPALASGLLALGALDREGDEGFSPFASEIRLGWDDAMAAPFFQDHYGEAERGEGGAWRRVNDDWLGGAATLALRAGGYTNNLSLVLAFDLPGSEKMLLFPADAQVGNWLSWHAIEGWKPVGDAAPARPPAAGVDADRQLGDAAQEERRQVPNGRRIHHLEPVDALGELAQHGGCLHPGQHVAQAGVDALAEAQVVPDVAPVGIELIG